MSAQPLDKKFIILMILVLLLSTLAGCDVYNELVDEADSPPAGEQPAQDDSDLPPGSDLPAGVSASADDPQAGAAGSENQAEQGGDGPLKPVHFRNLGSVAYTVTPWSYVPLDPSAPATLSDASTVAFPGGSNPSAYLDLPLGTYTWCYHWEQGDTNGDGMIEYAHAIDARPVRLDQNASDDLDLAPTVDLSAPTYAGELSGRCDQSASASASFAPRPQRENGARLFVDDGSGGAAAMFAADYMTFGYQGGQAQLSANAANFVLPAMYSDGSYGDLIIEVDFTAFNAGEGGQYSLIFRSDAVEGGLSSYYILSLIPARRTLELAVWRDGWQGTSVAAIEDEAISLAAPLHFRLEVSGDEFVAFINGAFAAGFVDRQISQPGIVGMSITVDSAPGAYTYDNLAIYALP